MGLDIEIKIKSPIICPCCNKVVTHIDKEIVASGGRTWYPFLEKVGYYVPFELRNEYNDWYGKDMFLDENKANCLYDFVKKEAHNLYNGGEIKHLLANAILNKETIAINADW